MLTQRTAARIAALPYILVGVLAAPVPVWWCLNDASCSASAPAQLPPAVDAGASPPLVHCQKLDGDTCRGAGGSETWQGRWLFQPAE